MGTTNRVVPDVPIVPNVSGPKPKMKKSRFREVSNVKTGEAVAVGRRDFVEKVRSELGIKALHRELEQVDGTYTLRESGEAYMQQSLSPRSFILRRNRFICRTEIPKSLAPHPTLSRRSIVKRTTCIRWTSL
jgi:hypothetical protein